MMIPDGFFIIHQPKYQTPGIFDLHQRGRFKTRPFITENWNYRIVANNDLVVKLQYACLVEENTIEPETRIPYNFAVKAYLIDLDENLKSDPETISRFIPNKDIQEKILAAHDEWRNAYIPLNDKKMTDSQGLEKKIRTSINECRARLRKQLAHRNSDWVMAILPWRIQNFKYGLYLLVKEELHEQYRQLGGKENTDELIKKIVLFCCIYDNDEQNRLHRSGRIPLKNEDEIWECWTGFAGSETEARLVCDTMEAVFRPLAQRMTA